ncbi:MAG: hypothetical protein LC777_12050 [Actinobacteria bacterium]|nr:hypothetical protein [Actinomycetota bacterium]
MSATQTIKSQAGIVVSTPLTAGGGGINHAEGIVVSTALTAGGGGINHAEGIVVPERCRDGASGRERWGCTPMRRVRRPETVAPAMTSAAGGPPPQQVPPDLPRSGGPHAEA